MLTENETSAEAVEELTDLELRGELINYLCSFMLVAPRAFNRYQAIVREKRALAACCSPQKSQLFIDDAVVAEIDNDRKRDSSFIAKFEEQKKPLLNFFGCGAGAFRAVEICHSDKSKAEAHFKKLARAIRETRYNVSLPEFETSIKKLKKQYFKLADALTELPAEPAPEPIATGVESSGSPKTATAESKPIKISGTSSTVDVEQVEGFDADKQSGATPKEIGASGDEPESRLLVSKTQMDILLAGNIKADSLRKSREITWPEADEVIDGSSSYWCYQKLLKCIKESTHPKKNIFLSTLPKTNAKARGILHNSQNPNVPGDKVTD